MPAQAAKAAGGAHIVDDAGVETPGHCHMENWGTTASGRTGLVNVALACTVSALPSVEWGGFIAHGWTPEDNDTLVGLSPKILLTSEEQGLGIGISASFAYGIDRHRWETASVIIPLTMPVSKSLRVNMNAGWQWTRIAKEHDLFLGAQAEIKLARRIMLMTEALARDRGRMGGQTGIRWTGANGRLNIDLLAGRYLDGETSHALTFGITMR
ncbi:MAG: hypothetical protein QM690_00200 [Sphingobium sp.]